MLFDQFDEDVKCGVCGKSLKDLASGRASCKPCKDEVDEKSARMGAWGHAMSAVVYLFGFDFIGFFVELLWSIQRMTHSGDYGDQGKFTKILNKPQVEVPKV